jgi:hypothetical protein
MAQRLVRVTQSMLPPSDSNANRSLATHHCMSPTRVAERWRFRQACDVPDSVNVSSQCQAEQLRARAVAQPVIDSDWEPWRVDDHRDRASVWFSGTVSILMSMLDLRKLRSRSKVLCSKGSNHDC